MAPQTSGTLQVGAGVGTEESDRQVLALGFRLHPALGDRSSLLGKLEDLLKSRLESLLPLNANGGLSDEDLANLLLKGAETFLKSNQFGFVIDDVLEPILKRLITRLITKRRAENSNTTPTTPPTPTTRSIVPNADGTITITGTITGTFIVTPTPAAGGGPVPGPENRGAMIKNLKNDGGTVAPTP